MVCTAASHVADTRHAPHFTGRMSHVTLHGSHATRYTSRFTCHTLHPRRYRQQLVLLPLVIKHRPHPQLQPYGYKPRHTKAANPHNALHIATQSRHKQTLTLTSATSPAALALALGQRTATTVNTE